MTQIKENSTKHIRILPVVQPITKLSKKINFGATAQMEGVPKALHRCRHVRMS